MKTVFPHQRFIAKNNVKVGKLPEMLRRRIDGFDQLDHDMEQTTEHDRDALFDKLETLSYELEQDLEEHFEEELENNEDPDEEVIRELVQAKVRSASPKLLRSKGFRGSLESREIEVGKFRLIRHRFENNYTIYSEK